MLIKIYNQNPNIKEISKVVDILRDGGLIVYPTDTVYAIGCDALNVRAVEKICKIKNIDPKKANLSIICYDLSDASEYVKIDTPTFKVLKRNLPGPFTFILNTTNTLPKILKHRKTIGIRIPDNNIIRELVKELGNPIITTSIHDKDDVIEYATDPELIHDKYENIVDIVIDGGYGEIEPSTIVDCTGDEPVVVRQGKGKLLLS